MHRFIGKQQADLAKQPQIHRQSCLSAPPGERRSDVLILNTILDVHVLELAGLEDLAALFAFHELGFFVAAHNLYAGVPARLLLVDVRRRDRRLGTHVIRMVPEATIVPWGRFAPEFFGYCRTAERLVKPSEGKFVTRRVSES